MSIKHRAKPRVALVTGAAGAIGSATVAELRGAGYRIIALDIRPVAESDLGPQGRSYVVDLTDADDVLRVVQRGESEVGPPQLVVCIAGTLMDRPLMTITTDEWRSSIRIHLGGTYHVIRAVVPGMRSRGRGSIVTISSGQAIKGHPRRADYVAAKASIIGFTRALARELGPDGIRANCVGPGPVDTAMIRDFSNPEAIASSLPLRRLGRPEEIAQAIRMVGEAQWTTGQLYSPNGGSLIQ